LHCLRLKFIAISFGKFSFTVFSFVLLDTWQYPYHASFFFFFRLHLSMSLFFLIQTHERTPQKQIREHVHPSQLKLKKNTNYCGLEQFLSLEGLLWCFLALSWDSWRFIPCWFIRLVALSKRNIVLVSLQDLSLHRDFSSHQEVWAELALRSLKKNGIRIRKWLR